MDNLYEIFNVQQDATEKEIRRAYRKKAKECHPDKNPDNPDADALFKKLTSSLETLLNPTTRAELDRSLKAKKLAEERNKSLDKDRKKFKDDLDAREAASSQEFAAKVSKLSAEERIRKETEKLIEEEFLKQEESVRSSVQTKDKPVARIKIRWEAKKGDTSNGGYSYDVLHGLFSKYGDIVGLVVSKKKGGSALLEFSKSESAEMAKQYEIGLMNKPLTLSWVGVDPSSAQKKPRDYESVSEMDKRREEERRRLIEEMMRDD